MNVLTRFLLHTRQCFSPGPLMLVGWVIIVGLLEVIGRQAHDDTSDALALLMLFCGGVLSLSVPEFRHSGAVLSILRGGRAIVIWCRRFALDLGADLRREPPIAPKWPPVMTIPVAILLTSTIGLAVAAGWFPTGARSFITQGSYTLWLLLIGSLWTVSALSILMFVLLAFGAIHDRFVLTYSGQRRRPVRAETIACGGLLIVLAIAGMILPVWVPVVGLLLLLGLITVVFGWPYDDDLILVWRSRYRPAEVCSVRSCHLFGAQLGGMTLLVLTLLVMMLGDRLWTLNRPAMAEAGSTPLTLILGTILAWTSVPGLIGLSLEGLRPVMNGLALRRWQRKLPVVCFTDPIPARAQAWFRRILGEHGWQCRFAPARPKPNDLLAGVAESGWTIEESPGGKRELQVAADAVDDPEFLWALGRRAQIAHRRQLINGLKRVFKRAARLPRRRGTGYWVGPQHWFVAGLGRDVDPDISDDRDATTLSGIIGPPYQQILTWDCRMHFLEITRALEIDLIFVEDGVSFRRFVRVLRVMFETFDVHDGRQRAEEAQFQGLPGVRAIIHNVSHADHPDWSQSDYPEPNYDEIGRARILHVFRDRSEEEALESAPRDFEGVPVLS